VSSGTSSVAIRRLRNQAIAGAARRTPADVVTWLGAVQAQEYGPAIWAIALRMAAGTRLDDIERAIDAGRILRTRVMRPTCTRRVRGRVPRLAAPRSTRVFLRLERVLARRSDP
jgi:hypothetical protein